MDWQAGTEFIKVFGFPTFFILLLLYLLTVSRRVRGASGQLRDRSPRLVPGNVVDDLQDELAAVRSSYTARAQFAHEDCEKQIAYFRDKFESERGRFEAVNANAIEQTKLIKELRVEILESRKRAAK